jgi:hypothetical protein
MRFHKAEHIRNAQFTFNSALHFIEEIKVFAKVNVHFVRNKIRVRVSLHIIRPRSLDIFSFIFVPPTACAFDIRLYLTPLGQARQFIETCGT